MRLNAQNHAYVKQNNQDLYVDPNELPNYVPVAITGTHIITLADSHNFKPQSESDKRFDFKTVREQALQEDLLSEKDKHRICDDFKETISSIVQRTTKQQINLQLFEYIGSYVTYKYYDYNQARQNTILTKQIGDTLKENFKINYQVLEDFNPDFHKYPNVDLLITIDLKD